MELKAQAPLMTQKDAIKLWKSANTEELEIANKIVKVAQ
jgi:hypothetical protein